MKAILTSLQHGAGLFQFEGFTLEGKSEDGTMVNIQVEKNLWKGDTPFISRDELDAEFEVELTIKKKSVTKLEL